MYAAGPTTVDYGDDAKMEVVDEDEDEEDEDEDMEEVS